MGQKVNPNGMRLGIVKDFNAKWYAEKGDYAKFLVQDLQVREFLENKLKNAAVSDCLLYTSPSPRDKRQSRMPSSA